MNIEEKMELIRDISAINGDIIIKKLQEKDTTEDLKAAMEIAKKLVENGIGKFDFSSEENFENSLAEFLEVSY